MCSFTTFYMKTMARPRPCSLAELPLRSSRLSSVQRCGSRALCQRGPGQKERPPQENSHPHASRPQREREGSEGHCPTVPTSVPLDFGPSYFLASLAVCTRQCRLGWSSWAGCVPCVCDMPQSGRPSRPVRWGQSLLGSSHTDGCFVPCGFKELPGCQAAVRETADKHCVCTLDASVLGEAAQKPNPFIQTKCLEKAPFSLFWLPFRARLIQPLPHSVHLGNLSVCTSPG